MAKVLENLKYTKEHEWVAIDGDVASVGITDYAQDALGDITFVELPDVGDEVEAGDTFGVVESVKTFSDLYAPVSGEIIEINGALEDAPDGINEDCYGAWIVKIRVTGGADALLDAPAYEAIVAGEE